MKITNDVTMLEISSNIMGAPSMIYPTLITDNDAVILVDTGFPGQLALIRESIEQAGTPFDKLNMLIITHHDIDHVGNIAAIQNELPGGIQVLAYADEKAYIQGDKRPLKLAKLEDNLADLPDQTKALYEKLKSAFQNAKANVDRTLTDCEELPYAGGIVVIFTPGHTLGHICLYLRQSKTLIAGDALRVDAGKLELAPPSNNFDTEMCKHSLKKLAKYDIEKVICYHGGFYDGDANQRIATLANQ
jgi:glyoxylase-like metal-dependent hydrolase (beta-lactamase superfamily II)